MYDIIIIGCGPAGMTAAIYAKQARKNILILEKEAYGGQIAKTGLVKNYPGYLEINGFDLATNMFNQVKELDCDIRFEEVLKINNSKNYKEVITKNNTYKGLSIIIATGATNRKLNLKNEDNFLGKGISYCATCDGMFYKNKTVAITGGGNQAIDEALYLSNIVDKLYIIYRNAEFKIDSINLNLLKDKDNITFIMNSNITNLNGENTLNSVTIQNNITKEEKDIDVDGLFIAIGHIPVSSMCSNIIDLDNNGYIIAKEDCLTNIEGIFAAGDIREKNIRQLTTACSDGCTSAINAIKYINKIKKDGSLSSSVGDVPTYDK